MSAGRSVLIITLGPVQDFIASARSCQDLWFGSWLLSELSRTVAVSVAKAGGAVAFPTAAEDDAADRPGVANKILAQVSGDPSDVAECARAEMLKRLANIRDEVLGAVLARNDIDGSVVRAQLDDLIEYAWVAVPEGAGPEGYPNARAAAERALAARKNTRVWRQPTWTKSVSAEPSAEEREKESKKEPPEKSSLDGAREAVAPPSGGPPPDDAARWQRYRARPGEHLCGVGLLKRFGSDPLAAGAGRPAFHSTHAVAAAPLYTRMQRDSALGARIKDYLDGVGVAERVGLRGTASVRSPLGTDESLDVDRSAFGRDADVLYEGRLDALALEHGKDAAWTTDAQRKLREALRGVPGRAPPAYYALLMADGDHMGQAIDACRTFESHRELGARLNAFAGGARGIVEAGAGSLIYAGGDDVLALAPLHTALDVADALRKSFATTLAGQPGAPTLSVGLAVCHHMEDLSDVRAVAQRAERLAKSHGRNALAIIVDKRSGGELAWVDSWENDPVERLHGWVRALHEEALPDGIAFELERIAAELEDVASNAAPEMAVVEALVRRAVRRKRANRGAETLGDDIATRLLDGATGSLDDVRRRACELQVARVFLDPIRVAWGGIP